MFCGMMNGCGWEINMKLVTGYKSDRGNTRKVNQDAVVLKQISYRGKSFIILAVCDGIGGLEHGEVASALAVRRIEEWFDEVAGWLDIIETDGELVYSHLKDLAEECNELVRECRVTMQMETGSTMSLLMVLRDTYYIIQVGDSRVYRYRGRVLEQLTEDAAKKQAIQRLYAYEEKLIEKGVQISENNVKIEINHQDCVSRGTLTVIERTGREAPTEKKTQPKERTPEDG